MMAITEKANAARTVAQRFLLVGATLLVIYVSSAVIVSVLARRGIVSSRSSGFRVVAQLYDPLFFATEHVPGADDAFARTTCWLAGVEP